MIQKNIINIETRILIPEGYEIDEKNSTFECIKFVLLEENPTYEYIYVKGFLKKKFSTLNGIAILNGGIAKMMRWLIRIILQMRTNLKDY